MTVQIALKHYLETTGESMRALSLRAGLGSKAVSDILSIPGLKPRHKTLVALSKATNKELTSAAECDPQTYQQLLDALSAAGKGTLTSRVKWLMRKANWFGNRPVCRHDVIEFFDRHNAASLGLSKGSRSTYKSDVLAALDACGARNRKRGVADLTGVYADVHAALKESTIPDSYVMLAGSFFIFLQDRGISHQAITTAVLAEYFAHRMNVSTASEQRCRRHVKDVCTLLSHLATCPETAHFGFQFVPHPFANQKDKFDVDNALLAPLLAEFDTHVAPWLLGERSREGLTKEDFIASLDQQDDAVTDKKAALRRNRAMKAALPGANGEQKPQNHDEALLKNGFLTTTKRWSEKTLATRRGYIVSLAKALAASCDVVPETIAELVDPEFLEAASEALRDSNQGEHGSSYVGAVLKAVKKIARDYTCCTETDLKQIQDLITFHDVKYVGIAPRNKAKLIQFTEDRIQKTVDLSGTVVSLINEDMKRRRASYRKKHGKAPEISDILHLEMARDIAAMVAHEILLKRAPRSANVIGIQLDWIVFQEGEARITVPAVEVKGRGQGDANLVVPLGQSASKLLRHYIETVRPVLVAVGDDANPYLFPGQAPDLQNRDRPYASLLLRVTSLLEEHVGARINPHLYRHLIGWIWLKESVDNLPQVQRLLGHKSLQTTLNYYAELDENLVFDNWQDWIDGKRKGAKA